MPRAGGGLPTAAAASAAAAVLAVLKKCSFSCEKTSLKCFWNIDCAKYEDFTVQ